MHSTNCGVCKRPDYHDGAAACHDRKEPKKRKGGPGKGIRGTLLVHVDSGRNNGAPDKVASFVEAFDNLSDCERKTLLEKLLDALSECEYIYLLTSIGIREKQKVKHDAETISKEHSDLESMNKLQPKEYLGKRNSAIVAFISGFLTTTISVSSDKSVLQVINILENIYHLTHNRFIGPFSLLQNLTMLSITGSKLAVNIMGSICAAGKYTHLNAILASGAKNELHCPNGDIIVMFDNEQVVGKTWNVRPNNKVRQSVVTNVAVVSLEPNGTLQENDSLSPREWFSVMGNEDIVENIVMEKPAGKGDCHDQTAPCLQKWKTVHNEQLAVFIQAAIEQIVEDDLYDENLKIHTDAIDTLVKKEKDRQLFKRCPSCSSLVAKKKRKCPQCKSPLTQIGPETEMMEGNAAEQYEVKLQNINERKRKSSKLHEDRTKVSNYDHIPSNHQAHAIPIELLDPVFVNPNSKESLILVLRHIGTKAGVRRYGGTKRSWVIICCDGLPYTIILSLIQEQIICLSCNQSICGQQAFQKHCTSVHADTPANDVMCAREFDWVLLRIGEGHYEMNLMKAFMELNWSVFMCTLTKKMGWTSENAQRAALHCYDNHKTWQLLLVFHFGSLLELVRTYVIHCRQHDLTPTPQGFVFFAKARPDPNFKYMFEMVARYTQGIFNYRMGVRRNHSDLVISGKVMTKGLFHGRNHPRYQEIEMTEQFQRTVMPPEVDDFIRRHESLSKSGQPSSGQGYDFVLEEENKNVKAWIRHGVPNEETWLSVIRNAKTLADIRSNLLSSLELQANTTCKAIDLDDAIAEWRATIRGVEYLTKLDVGHTSIDGEMLDPELVGFTTAASRKRSYRIMHRMLKQELPEDPSLSHPVYVTPLENDHFNSLSKQTIPQIDSRIMDIISELQQNELRDACCEKYMKTVARKTKNVHIAFLQEVSQILKDEKDLINIADDLNIDDSPIT